MTDEEIVELGMFCEGLRESASFQIIIDEFKSRLVEHLLSTDPASTAKRETLYAEHCGVRDFIAHIDAIIAQKNELLEDNTAPSNEDALFQEEIDYQ